MSNLIECIDQLVLAEAVNKPFDPQRLKCEFRWALTVYLHDGSEEQHTISEDIYAEMKWSDEEETHYWNVCDDIQSPDYRDFYREMSESWSRVICLCMMLSFYSSQRNQDLRREGVDKEIATLLKGVSTNDCANISKAITDGCAFPKNYIFRRKRRTQDKIEEQLDEAIVGQNDLKEELKKLLIFYKLQCIRRDLGKKIPELSHHLIFKGNPGTGKTTVARLLGSYFYDIGVLETPKFTEVSRSDLVGGYIGQTAQITRAKLTEALGGVLFIDEAYALVAEDSPRDYGHEAIAELVKFMEDHRSRIVVVLAGYPDDMDRLLNENPGLKSRFQHVLNFDDYKPDELYYILERFAFEGDYHIDPKNKWIICHKIAQDIKDEEDAFGNARYVRNLFEKALLRHARRVEPDAQTIPSNELNELLVTDLFPND
jgi:SpoVK/Ycf46/Vps4 family AAA+-type ATPase